MCVKQGDIASNPLRLEPGTTKNDEGREPHMPKLLAALIQQCTVGKYSTDYLFTREDGQQVKDFRGARE